MSGIHTTQPPTGLTSAEVAARVADGRVNTPPDSPERTLGRIISSNVFTPVNAIMLVLFVLVVISGYWKDGLFVGVVVSNSVVGVAQEVKARRELARLQVVTAARASVLRDGELVSLPAEDVVIDDVLEITSGDQLVVDGSVLTAVGLQVDESMLTGESDPVEKEPGDELMSGSFVLAGHGRMQTSAVGADSYAGKLTTEARTFSDAESRLRQAIDLILHWLTYVIPVASLLLFSRLLGSEDRWQDALRGTVAAAVAMVPDGLVLLTSLAFVAGVLELTRRNALAKQLSTVEVLARVDTLCLDKTGTITTGRITYAGLHPLGEDRGDHDDNDGRGDLDDHDDHDDLGDVELDETVANVAAADDAPNATMMAIVDAFADSIDERSRWTVERIEPFSSMRKWSAVSFVGRGWYYIGAPDYLLAPDDPGRGVVEELSAAGKRLLALVLSPTAPDGDDPPSDYAALAVIELEDEIRPEANDILDYFDDQDVTIKVISGDHHATVSAIADRAGLPSGKVEGVDARTLPDGQPELAEALEAVDVFGRVAPRQKQAMVRALQSRGHVVAMTGDGVNDVLALKDADLGIAMGSGSAATRSVADLVLTDDSFSSLPTVVAEGRKVINNVERVANLFVSKAAYAVLLTVLIAVIGSPFPFIPRQLTLIGTLSIGVPGFFLALAPEVERVRTGFLVRVMRFAVPAGIAAGLATFVAYEVARRNADITLTEARTLATLVLLVIGLVILTVASRPLVPWKVLLVAAMAAGYCIILAVPFARKFFELDLFTDGAAWAIASAAVVAGGVAVVLVGLQATRLDALVGRLVSRVDP